PPYTTLFRSGVERVAHPDLGDPPRHVERTRPTQEIARHPTRLEPETVHAPVAGAEADPVTRSLRHPHQHADETIVRATGRRIHQRDAGRAEHAQPVEVPLALVDLVLAVGVPG